MTQALTKPPTLSIPSFDGTRTITIPLGEIARAEARQEELAYVTKDKAPELLRAINHGWLEVSKLALLVNRELNKAKKELAGRKAIILVDLLPQILVQKGIEQANAEVRQAVLDLDEEYGRREDRVEQIRVVLELLKIKAKGFENTFTAIKKVLGQSQLLSGADPTNLGHGPRSDDHLPVTAYRANGLLCEVCDMPQYLTPGGACCPQGHGGAPGRPKEDE